MVFRKILRQFKACVRYFPFIQQMIALLGNYEKCLFHLKSSFRSRDIQIFVFLTFFPPCSLL